MQRRLDPETGVNKPFKNVSCQGRIQNFFQREGIKFRDFFSAVFSAKLILGNLSNKNNSGGGGGSGACSENFTHCDGHFSTF